MQGLKALYLDNMMLSAVDIVQTVIEVTPFKLGKLVPKGLTKALTDRANKVLSYGLDKVDDLSRYTRRKAIVDYGSRILVSSALEGMEEGTQYIKG